jgi:hypothetical protein
LWVECNSSYATLLKCTLLGDTIYEG